MSDATKDKLQHKQLLILGNGFDLSLGLKTRYADFFDACIKSKSEIEYIVALNDLVQVLCQLKSNLVAIGNVELLSKIKQDIPNKFEAVNKCGEQPLFEQTHVDNLIGKIDKKISYESSTIRVANSVDMDQSLYTKAKEALDTTLLSSNMFESILAIGNRQDCNWCDIEKRIEDSLKVLKSKDNNLKQGVIDYNYIIELFKQKYKDKTVDTVIEHLKQLEQSFCKYLVDEVIRVANIYLDPDKFIDLVNSLLSDKVNSIDYSKDAQSDYSNVNILTFNYTNLFEWRSITQRINQLNPDFKQFKISNVHGKISMRDNSNIIFGVDDSVCRDDATLGYLARHIG
ncbi:MAG: bacteriophage abortive infection AbiH family protein [Clostridiales bacterium]|jgi:hypothetical protein|nr:bacteriophage abortive infection AbiH family protein [Clostridiales bacterium]